LQTADWKKKKKDAEKDPLVGANFFLMVDSQLAWCVSLSTLLLSVE
jgi:hypothetical protein